MLSNSKILKIECVGESMKLPVSCYTGNTMTGLCVDDCTQFIHQMDKL